MKALFPLVMLALVGCASTGIVPMDKDTFMVSKRAAQAGFGPPVAAKADIYRQANEFCASRGKKVETVDYQGTDSGFGRPASASLQFRCIE
ncbi:MULTISPECIES: hypothetical protein [Xanthomonas]|nr:hypothetical protein [Xanthomonas phaseoli]MBO9769149.1 hypothetical protein [Xanthomonas phaseoli pv. dieffenbachiae]MBO9776452.1 hypothetical protein [Xanthomonas phaseoli pv. dieffenbachiae]MBO9781127.1 hypothetical protein [Xanthomonas phaseoli pv. dieffenbachiae]MBO9788860.1 hypothetical protein [Xanthomonas phaseoli pv. dieffenbachiae]MBO9794621.1 hypothetical protein [Xanthomonas phaseoli pv. dieffenbachiae]